MGIWTHSLKFNVGTGGIHQLPQTTEDGIHSLLKEVVWDVGDNVPNPVLQLFHCARFCPVHLLLCPAPQEKVTGREIWTSLFNAYLLPNHPVFSNLGSFHAFTGHEGP